jgi:hypothetical protein
MHQCHKFYSVTQIKVKNYLKNLIKFHQQIKNEKSKKNLRMEQNLDLLILKKKIKSILCLFATLIPITYGYLNPLI